MIPKREYRILTQDEINTRRRLGMALDPRVLRKQGMILPVEGARPDEDDDDDSSDDDDDSADEDDDDSEEDKKKKKKTSGSSADEDDDSDEDEDDGDVKLTKNEAARLRRKAKELDDLKKKEQKDKKDADRRKKQEEGKWQELIDEEKEKATTAETERDEAKTELSEYKFQNTVSSVAQRLGFRDPTDAFRYLDKKELIDAEEDVLESALKRVLKKKSYLKSDRKATGGGGGGKDPAGSWDINDIKKMSTDEINENWNKPGFQEALENAGA